MPLPLLRSLSRFRRHTSEADRLLWQTARQHWQLLGLNLGTSLLGALFEGGTFGIIFLSITLLTEPTGIDWNRYAVLKLVPGKTTWLNGLSTGSVFLGLLVTAVIAQVILSGCKYLNSVSLGYLAARLRVQITEQIHRQILSLSFACASHYKVGDLVNYATLADFTIQFQLDQLNRLISNSCLLLIYLLVLVAVSPWLLLAAVALAVTNQGLQTQVLPRIRQTANATETHQVEVLKQITENIQGLRFLHTTGRQAAASLQVRQLLKQVAPNLQRQARLLGLAVAISQLLPVLMLALLTGFAYLLFQDRSTGIVPSLVTFVLALQRFSARLQGIFASFNSFAENNGRLERLNTILDPHDKEFARLSGRVCSGLESDIYFDRVSLRYGPNQPEVLREISLMLPKGQVTALVGRSGAGKSSLADLLVGLYEPTSGMIMVNGHDLHDYDLASWRQHIGVVSQDMFIFNTSIRENIRFGRPEASEAEVIAAAEAAQADCFICELPEGYDTVVGERGYRLSGGQKQRIAMAMAILRDPDLLILDEATSALDSESERLVQQALQDFGQNRTVLVIAHRLSTIVDADQIMVLEQGQIVEQGTHAQLLQRQGAYARYWWLQSQQSTTV